MFKVTFNQQLSSNDAAPANTILVLEPTQIITSRLINNKMYKLTTDISDTTDLIVKGCRLSSLSNDDYILFSNIQCLHTSVLLEEI